MAPLKSITELPSEPFFVLMWNDSVQIPGDERSRTNPGHGYPASTEYFVRMQVCSTKEELQKELEKRFLPHHGTPKNVRVFGCEELNFETKIEIKT